MGSDRPPVRSDPPRRLWIFRPTLGQGGADRVTLELLRSLDRARFDPRLVLMRREGELLGDVPTEVPVVGFGAGSLWSAWWPLARALRREPPDILFSTSGGGNLAAALAHLFAPRGIRLVLSERNALTRDQPPLKGRLQRALKRLLYRRAALVTAVSEGLARELAERLRLDAGQIAVVRNPLVTAELDELAAAPAPHPWLDDPVPVVLGVGRLVPAKDFGLLLEAFAELRRHREARLLILGEGPLRGALERRAGELGIGAEVAMPGFVANPFAYMARATLFVLSSRFEGLPGALVQAMACGAPVIATDCPHGPAEIVRHRESGLLVPVGDGRRLAEALATLLDDPDLRARLARAGREAVAPWRKEPALATYVEALGGSR